MPNVGLKLTAPEIKSHTSTHGVSQASALSTRLHFVRDTTEYNFRSYGLLAIHTNQITLVKLTITSTSTFHIHISSPRLSLELWFHISHCPMDTLPKHLTIIANLRAQTHVPHKTGTLSWLTVSLKHTITILLVI